MDQNKIDYFLARYRQLVPDELTDLHARRSSLADEAVVALDSVLAARGIDPHVLDRFTQQSATLGGDDTAGTTPPRSIAKMVAQFGIALVALLFVNVLVRVTLHWLGIAVLFCIGVYLAYTRFRAHKSR